MRFRKELKMKNIKDKLIQSIEEVAKEVDMQNIVEINFKINHNENSMLVGIKDRNKNDSEHDGENDDEHDGENDGECDENTHDIDGVIEDVGEVIDGLKKIFKEAAIVADFFKLVKNKVEEDSEWIDTINEAFLELKKRGNERFEIQIKNGDNLS